MNVLFFLMLVIIIFLLGLIITFIIFGRKVVFIDAVELYKKGNTEEALEKLKTYVITQKNDIKARELLARIYMEKGEEQSALKEYIGITLSNASNVVEKSNAYCQMTKMYYREKELNKAIIAAGNGLKNFKENVEIYYYLGKIYQLMDKERRANKMFNEALKYDKNHVLSRIELVNIHFAEKAFNKARFHLKRILEIDSNNDEARYKLAELHYAEDELEESARELEDIKEIKGKENLYYRVLSEYYLKIKNLDRAEFILEKMIEKIELFQDIKLDIEYNLANIYEIKEKYQEALDLYKEVKDKNARYKDVEERVKNLMKLINPEEFKAILDEINFSEMSYESFVNAAKVMIDKMGMLLNYQLEDTGKIFSCVISDKYSMNNTKTKYLFLMTRNLEVTPRDLQKFRDKMGDNKIDHGIYVTLGEYTESAIEFANNVENLEILDKVHVHDIVGRKEIEDTE